MSSQPRSGTDDAANEAESCQGTLHPPVPIEPALAEEGFQQTPSHTEDRPVVPVSASEAVVVDETAQIEVPCIVSGSVATDNTNETAVVVVTVPSTCHVTPASTPAAVVAEEGFLMEVPLIGDGRSAPVINECDLVTEGAHTYCTVQSGKTTTANFGSDTASSSQHTATGHEGSVSRSQHATGKQQLLMKPSRQRRFICEFIACNFRSSELSAFEAHMRKHYDEDELFYKCDNGCTASFATAQSLAAHWSSHNKGKILVCDAPGCKYTSRTSAKFTNHKRRHTDTTGTTLYVCPIEGCTVSFNSSKSLEKHAEIHASRKVFVCPTLGCQFSTASSEIFERHQMKHVKKVCDYPDCGYFSFKYDQFRNHVKKHTKGLPKPMVCD